MPGQVLNINAVAMCAHGGKLTFTPNPKVMLSGAPAAAWTPAVPVAGCTNPPPPANSGPDATITLLPNSYSTKVLSNNQPLLLSTIAGMGNSGYPMQPCAFAGQLKVTAT